MIRAEQSTGDYLRDRERWSGPVDISETELGFLGVTASAVIQQQTKGHYPAPLAALEVMLGAVSADIDQACQMEAEGMAQLFGSPVNAALLNVFFLTDRNKKDTGVDTPGITPRADRVGVGDRRGHHGRGHRGGECQARGAGHDDRCESRRPGQGRRVGAGRGRVQSQDAPGGRADRRSTTRRC